MALPTPEALTLAANVFHADVDAWLPPSFGVARSQEAKEAEWAAARAFGALRGADRLGLGHPDAEDPEARRAAQVSRAGGDILKKALKRKVDDAGPASTPEKEDRDDGESRSRAVASKKRKTVDAFGKGKQAAVHPLLNLKNPIPGYDAPPEAKKAAVIKEKTEVDDSVNAAAALAASLSTGSATMSVVGKSAPTMSGVISAKIAPGSPKSPKTKISASSSEHASDAPEPKSKAALRREKRKAAKARKAAL
ncbi:hypothetical protein CspeluHIS016_0201450 [Cutaneotrichosporon spelunceum]|uniref:Uncharacterized protein n=1 Tax=Cutaneotrichosporon spelunceum TaxID=1672016 RepID=A0AAD3YAU6_9TREE|nr:hypothetical protein CspeluHIS016_0201450 [Cutaneotrichosporon spelunceum]